MTQSQQRQGLQRDLRRMRHKTQNATKCPVALATKGIEAIFSER